MKIFQKFKGSVIDIIVVVCPIIYALYLGMESRKIIGGIIVLLGIIFWVMARYNLGTAFSIKPQAKAVVNTRLYKKIKHPIYLFSTIAVLGVCIMYNIWWMYVLLVLLIITQWIRTRFEEKVLTKTFGQKYLDYKKQTWF